MILLALTFTLLLALSFFHPEKASATINVFFEYFQWNPQAGYTLGSPGNLISVLLPNVLMLAGIICFILIILGGFQLILYGGQYNAPAKVSQAKNLVTYGFIGFLLVLSAFFILQIVSTITGINFMNANVI